MRRSQCPVSNALDHLGDKWSLLVIRDIALNGKRTYSALLESAEQMATNILADRLARLEASGILQKAADPEDGRRKIYRLTERGKDLLPILIEMIVWSMKYDQGLSAPDGFVERAQGDRAGLIADLRARLQAADG